MPFRSPRPLRITRPPTQLDRLALLASEALERARVRYVFVSGYVAILFGRSRESEDVDVIIEPVNRERRRFVHLWRTITRRLPCILTDDPVRAWEDYILRGSHLRFAMRGRVLPNLELHPARDPLDFHALRNRIPVELGRRRLYVGPFEEQIAYKLYMGSLKDIEDARHLYRIFEERLDPARLRTMFEKLHVPARRMRKLEAHREEE